MSCSSRPELTQIFLCNWGIGLFVYSHQGLGLCPFSFAAYVVARRRLAQEVADENRRMMLEKAMVQQRDQAADRQRSHNLAVDEVRDISQCDFVCLLCDVLTRKTARGGGQKQSPQLGRRRGASRIAM